MATPVYVYRMLERAGAKGHYDLVERVISGLSADFTN